MRVRQTFVTADDKDSLFNSFDVDEFVATSLLCPIRSTTCGPDIVRVPLEQQGKVIAAFVGKLCQRLVEKGLLTGDELLELLSPSGDCTFISD